jgi:RimJ/RimL family protein N-acetyltransferase|tara:strand:- start:855 stop:1391 length:537 start_codon:yes stop_codon:yes gene_type:complete
MIEPIRVQSTFRTKRLILRPTRKSDLGLIGLYAGDIRVSGHTRSIPHPLPPGAAEAFIEQTQNLARTEDVWVLDGSDFGLDEVLGVIGLKRLDRRQGELGYWLAPAYWGVGLAREAVGTLIGANPQASTTLFAEVFQENARSAKLLTDMGFSYLGEAESYCVARQTTVASWTYLRKMT